jgi:hypothetical protein
VLPVSIYGCYRSVLISCRVLISNHKRRRTIDGLGEAKENDRDQDCRAYRPCPCFRRLRGWPGSGDGSLLIYGPRACVPTCWSPPEIYLPEGRNTGVEPASSWLATGLAVSFIAIGLFEASIGFSIGLEPTSSVMLRVLRFLGCRGSRSSRLQSLSHIEPVSGSRSPISR